MQSHPTPSAHVCTPPTAGTFTHTPRPPRNTGTPEHAWQRYFAPESQHGGLNHLRCSTEEAREMRAGARVWRDASRDTAEVSITLGLYTCASIAVQMQPAELRDLAARLIDAAHDIEANPAAALIAAGAAREVAA
ncbi:hypothetical protein [Acidovorax sp. Q11]